MKTRVWVGCSVSRAHKTWSRWFLLKDFPFVLFLNEKEKRRLYLNRVNPLKLPQPEPLDLSILFSLVELGFCVRASVYWETDVHNRARCPSAQILGLSSKRYPSNMPRMPIKDLSRFMQSLSRGRQNRVRERKSLLSHQHQMGCVGPKKLLAFQHIYLFLFETRKILFDICLFVCFRKDPIFKGASGTKGFRLFTC